MVKIMIDSAADIGEAEANRLGVIMLPIAIRIGEEEYWDGVTLTPQAFYEKLVESAEIPKTSLINEYRFQEAIEQHLGEGDSLLILTISSKLSGTYAAAKRAAEGYEGRVFVVDTLNAALGERLLCEYALRLRAQGLAAAEIAARLEEEKGRVDFMAVLSTLEYLKKGGRISAAVALAGAVFSIKPVISVVNGEIKLVGKAIGSKKGNNLLTRLVEEQGGIDFSMPFGTIWSGLDSTLLDKYVADSASLWQGQADEVPRYPLGGTIGTHIGPGGIGVAFFRKMK